MFDVLPKFKAGSIIHIRCGAFHRSRLIIFSHYYYLRSLYKPLVGLASAPCAYFVANTNDGFSSAGESFSGFPFQRLRVTRASGYMSIPLLRV